MKNHKSSMGQGGSGQVDAVAPKGNKGGSVSGLRHGMNKKATGEMSAFKNVAGGAVDMPPKSRV